MKVLYNISQMITIMSITATGVIFVGKRIIMLINGVV